MLLLEINFFPFSGKKIKRKEKSEKWVMKYSKRMKTLVQQKTLNNASRPGWIWRSDFCVKSEKLPIHLPAWENPYWNNGMNTKNIHNFQYYISVFHQIRSCQTLKVSLAFLLCSQHHKYKIRRFDTLLITFDKNFFINFFSQITKWPFVKWFNLVS